MVATACPGQLPGLDDQPESAAAATLRAVCASERWMTQVIASRPHGDLVHLTAVSDTALAELSWPDVEQALAAHPRIGDRAAGDEREATWSRQEQSAAAAGDSEVHAELRAANVAYEQRFGWVFLICASGRSAVEILAAARARLGNDVATEQDVVRSELRDIVRLRLAGAFAAGTTTTTTASLSTHVLDAVTGRPAVGMAVRLERRDGADRIALATRVTDADGRVRDLAGALEAGVFRLVFDTGAWAGRDPAVGDAFYPEVVITFRVPPGGGHLHVPLLLSPFAYSTYRGS